MTRTDVFRYERFAIDAAEGSVTCNYATTGHHFRETFTFPGGGDWGSPALPVAARLLFLLAGVSYYKTAPAATVDLGGLESTAAERDFLASYYVNGLGEFAHRNGLDLRGLQVSGPDAPPATAIYDPEPGRPLIPFGGGIDSLVTVAALAGEHPGAALCVVEPPRDRFAAIASAAAATGLPVRRVRRRIDPLVRRSDELGFLNGHVPVTGILTAAALVAAVLEGRDAVVLSNEWSASVPTLVSDGFAINHQWSKGADFERGFGDVVAAALGPGISVFSYLRPRSELWVARQFAQLPRFHGSFRSCNRAFHQDPNRRLDHWCGRCDKCCFVDLVLAPFMERADLRAVFGGDEPLDRRENEGRFRALVGLDPDAKPFECVGDADECRAAVLLAADRADRADAALLGRLRGAVAGAGGGPDPAALFEPRSSHRIPDRYAPGDLLVRAR